MFLPARTGSFPGGPALRREDLGILQANGRPHFTACGIQTPQLGPRAPPPSPFAPCTLVFWVTPATTLPLPFLSGHKPTTEGFWAICPPSHYVLLPLVSLLPPGRFVSWLASLLLPSVPVHVACPLDCTLHQVPIEGRASRGWGVGRWVLNKCILLECTDREQNNSSRDLSRTDGEQGPTPTPTSWLVFLCLSLSFLTGNED